MTSPLSTRALAFGAMIFAFLTPASPAAAHAVVVESTPAVNATIHGSSLGIVLRYNSRIDHDRSRLTLTGADGMARPLAISTGTPADIVAADATGLVPGTYRLRWQVLAIDGHLTRGDIPFSVVAP